jgi:hypothetical protein
MFVFFIISRSFFYISFFLFFINFLSLTVSFMLLAHVKLNSSNFLLFLSLLLLLMLLSRKAVHICISYICLLFRHKYIHKIAPNCECNQIPVTVTCCGFCKGRKTVRCLQSHRLTDCFILPALYQAM